MINAKMGWMSENKELLKWNPEMEDSAMCSELNRLSCLMQVGSAVRKWASKRPWAPLERGLNGGAV